MEKIECAKIYFQMHVIVFEINMSFLLSFEFYYQLQQLWEDIQVCFSGGSKQVNDEKTDQKSTRELHQLHSHELTWRDRSPEDQIKDDLHNVAPARTKRILT